MCNTNDNVIYGVKKTYEIFFKSLAQYSFDCLKKRNYEDVLGIDAVENKTLTCGELLERSVKLSKVLKEMSILKGDIVALLCENTIKSYTPLMALLFSGLPIHFTNFAYSLDELRHAFRITKPKLAVCSKASLDKVLLLKKELGFIKFVIVIDEFAENSEEIADIDTLIKDVVANVKDFKVADVHLEDTVFLCMSSGTTGLPKCVELTNRNFIYVIDYIRDKDCFNISSNETTVSVLPSFHVFGQIVYLTAIATDMKIVLLKAFKPDIFLQIIQTYKVTKLFMVPTLLHFLATSDKVNNYDISSVKDIIVAGSFVSEKLYDTALKRLSNATIRQLYGATELSGACTLQKSSQKLLTVGSLVQNVSCKIIDETTKKPLGPGQSGEICIKGMGVMKGYYGNPTETRKSIDNNGFYLTGDLGYYDTKGMLFIVGRIKELIKHKGFQVPPTELENLILNHPAVLDCAVIGKPDEIAGELPMACVVLRKGQKATEKDIIDFVTERISPQKRLYGGVVFIEQVPKSISGKIMRKELLDRYT